MRRSAGHTLIEMLLSIALLGILMGALLYLYLMGGRAVAQGDMRGDLLRDLQVPVTQMTRELETSCYGGLSIGPGVVSLLSSQPAGGGKPNLGTDGSVLWQKYVLFWHDAPTKTLRRREYPIPPTVTAQPIEMWQSLTLADYTVDGEIVGRNIVGWTASVPGVPVGSQRFRGQLDAEQIFRGEPRKLSLGLVLRLKN